MTTQAAPQFALSFSNDAVHLLERTAPPESAAPWRERGRALFDAQDFRLQIGALRDTARQADGKVVPVALVIPDDQILYTSVAAGDARGAAAVGQALDGLTPYRVEELAWDWRADGPEGLRVAAVARQTLREAEDFARRYGFAPGGFVADPPEGVYPGAPRFSMSDELAADAGTSDEDTLPGDELASLDEDWRRIARRRMSRPRVRPTRAGWLTSRRLRMKPPRVTPLTMKRPWTTSRPAVRTRRLSAMVWRKPTRSRWSHRSCRRRKPTLRLPSLRRPMLRPPKPSRKRLRRRRTMTSL